MFVFEKQSISVMKVGIHNLPMEPELEAFLKGNEEFQLNDHGKVHCTLTNHDIVAKMAEVEKYMKSSKYLHAKNWYVHLPFVLCLGIIMTTQSISHLFRNIELIQRSSTASLLRPNLIRFANTMFIMR